MRIFHKVQMNPGCRESLPENRFDEVPSTKFKVHKKKKNLQRPRGANNSVPIE